MILFPKDSKKGDKLLVTLSTKYKVNATFIATDGYSSKDFQVSEMERNNQYSIRFPYRVYLTFVSTDSEPADFEFKT